VRDAAWGCDWVGTPVQFQRCLVFIIVTANKEVTLTAGKFVPVCNKTMMNVRNCYLYYKCCFEHAKKICRVREGIIQYVGFHNYIQEIILYMSK